MRRTKISCFLLLIFFIYMSSGETLFLSQPYNQDIIKVTPPNHPTIIVSASIIADLANYSNRFNAIYDNAEICPVAPDISNRRSV